MKLTVREIAEACGGRILCGDAGAVVTSFVTDSRTAGPGTMFVPVVGERVDAHRFIPQVFAAGAAASFTQREDITPGGTLVLVEDSVAALQKAAAAWRRRFTIPVVGITGSVGKTTTKEMVALAVSVGKNTMKTLGNANSQVGLPLTVCRLEEEHEAAVIEMGVSMPGEMERLCAVARPDFAVMTNIGLSHIEYMKTQENIRDQKFHITDAFHTGSVLFLNTDDPLLRELYGRQPYPTVGFGMGDEADYRAVQICADGSGSTFLCKAPRWEKTVRVPGPGEHNIRNALAAIAVAETLGVDTDAAIAALGTYTPPAMRQQVHNAGGITVLDDTYNASPDSVNGALDILASLPVTGRRVAVLADMFELGDHTVEAHESVGAHAARRGIPVLAAVGAQAGHILAGYTRCGGMNCAAFADNAAVCAYLSGLLQPGDAVLVKGSRGMHTDEIVRYLLETCSSNC